MKRTAILAAALATGLLTAAGAWAQGNADRDRPPPPKEQPKEQPKAALKPISEVIAQIGRQTPGRSQDTRTVTQPDGSVIYQITWVTNADNRRITYIVDARTGQILSGR
jgi:uncharacterized membrane protein YkoI